jgi:hypothetical protein|tara:strand:+ start:709 stop:1359 length:651 start_codon:yes stop_codon:yes gene_type:complete
LERSAGDAHSTTAGEKMNDDYRIQELLQRDVYVGDTFVGVITGERFHPRDECVQSLRIKVVPGVAEEYMRKAADCAPLSKELVHSIRPDGAVKLSKSMRELQRRWRNTVRISEELFAPDELLDRAVLDNDGIDIGNVVGMVKIKRTYRGVVVTPHFMVRKKHGIEDSFIIPVGQLARTTSRLDEVILRCSLKRLLTLPSFLKLNGEGDESDLSDVE